MTDFKSGYTPIAIQQEQMGNEEVAWGTRNESKSKAHFIRRKQSSLNIKRCCGVTYVLPTESQ
jgi:hypothetical protein